MFTSQHYKSRDFTAATVCSSAQPTTSLTIKPDRGIVKKKKKSFSLLSSYTVSGHGETGGDHMHVNNEV